MTLDKREYCRQWRAANPEKSRESSRRWYAANRNRARENNRRWNSENPDRRIAYTNEWRARNPEKVRTMWVSQTHRRRAMLHINGGSFTAKEWQSLLDRTGHKCLACLRPDSEVRLAADHIVPVACGGSTRIENIQPLCQSCNSKKGPTAMCFLEAG